MSGAPQAFELWSRIRDWPLYDNRTIPNCSVVAAAHLIRCWTFHETGTPASVSDGEVQAVFQQVRKPQGVLSSDLFDLWRDRGIGGHHIAAYAFLDSSNKLLLQTALFACKGLYLSLNLPRSVRAQRVWDVAGPGDGGEDFTPGSKGLHAVAAVGYSPAYLDVVSLGRVQRVAWRFLRQYGVAAYAFELPKEGLA